LRRFLANQQQELPNCWSVKMRNLSRCPHKHHLYYITNHLVEQIQNRIIFSISDNLKRYLPMASCFLQDPYKMRNLCEGSNLHYLYLLTNHLHLLRFLILTDQQFGNSCCWLAKNLLKNYISWFSTNEREVFSKILIIFWSSKKIIAAIFC
jgi:hypothetical protein